MTVHRVDPHLRDTPFTPMQLAEYRAAITKSNEFPAAAEVVYTCDNCELAPKCRCAFDSYNIDGDCLYEK